MDIFPKLTNLSQGRGRMNSKIVFFLLLLGATATPVVAQQETEMTTGMRMVMPTDDAKAFRLVRPLVAAVQVKLADRGTFSGAINGLYGPSTYEAIAAYQASLGQERSSLPTVGATLSLMGFETEGLAAHLARVDLQTAMPMGAMDPAMPMGAMDPAMPMGAMDPAMPMGAMNHEMPMPGSPTGELDGDPSSAKSLMLMDMPGMVMDNRHTRAVRAVRELVAAAQIQLAEHDTYSGPIDGLPESEAMMHGLRAFQAQAGLEQTGSFDFPTAMRLFNLDPAEVASRYAGRLAVTDSPVAMDHALFGISTDRFSSLLAPESRATVGSEGNGAGAADTVRIEVKLKEFAFVPDTIRVPAGQPVMLVIQNAGLIPHEFMAGRNAEEDNFESDLFAGVPVTEMMDGMMMDGMMMDEMVMEEGAHGHAAGGHEETDGGERHGTMVMADAGTTVRTSFTLPESRRGVWSIGCFLPGHYQAGMRGTLIVY